MTIINTEIWTPWPFLWIYVFSSFWRQQVRNNWNSIFIIISNQTLICVRCISSYNSSSFIWSFSWFIIWNNNFMCWLNTKPLIQSIIEVFNIFESCWPIKYSRWLYITFTSRSNSKAFLYLTYFYLLIVLQLILYQIYTVFYILLQNLLFFYVFNILLI